MVLAVTPVLAALSLLAADPSAYGQGRAALTAGRTEEALRHFEGARREISGPWVDLRVAEATARAGRLDEAIGRLERVVDEEGASPIGRRALEVSARLLLQGGRRMAAADRYRDLALMDTASTPRHLFAAGEALESAGETAAAHQVYGAILWGYPESGFAHRAIGRMAALRADSGGTLPPFDPYEAFLAGKVSLQRGDALSAEAKFLSLEEGVIDLPMRDDVLYYAGVAAMRLSKYDDALSRFRSLRGDFPRSPYFHEAGLRILQTYVYRGEEMNPYLFRLYLREGVGQEAEDVRLDLARYQRAKRNLREALDLYAGVQGARATEARWEEALIFEDLDARADWERSTTAVLAAAPPGSIEAEAVRYVRARRDEMDARVDEALEAYARLAGEGRHPFYTAKAREAVLRLGANRYREAAAENLWNAARAIAERGETLSAYVVWRSIARGYPETTFRAEAETAMRRALSDLPGWPPGGVSIDAPAAAIGVEDADRRTYDTARALAAAGIPDEAADLTAALPPSPERFSALAPLASRAGQVRRALDAAQSLLDTWPVPVDRDLLPETFLRILHPVPYAARFRAAGDSFGVDPLLLLAVARRASRFEPTAVEGVRIGLLGVDPVAADWAARQLKISGFRLVDLFQPDTNILIGAYLIATAEKTFREPHLSVTAHWAGPGNVEAWLSAGMPRDEDRFVERIPFPESRAFAREVLADYRAYRSLYTGGLVIR